MEAFAFLVIFMIAVYICWNCKINKSTIVLIIVLGLAIYIMAYPVKKELFQESSGPSATLSSDLLSAAGIVRPSVFNCTTQIGKTAETDPQFTDINQDK